MSAAGAGGLAAVPESKYLESQGVVPAGVDHAAGTYGATGSADHGQLLQPATGGKRLVEAYLLWLPLGLLGAHHFYLRRPGWGVLYLLTFGMLGLGWLTDLVRMPLLVRRANDKLCEGCCESPQPRPRRVHLDDAYILWLPPFGLLGAHHFHLRRWGWGALYLLTFGMFGIGWLVDAVRLTWLVRDVNEKAAERDGGERTSAAARRRLLGDAYLLTASPITGLLGLQHYYLGRVGFGLYYTFTIGGLGVGWLVDLFRMAPLVTHVNKKAQDGDFGHKRLDDAYILLFPLGGFLGLHHFFLGRPCWGALYMCTFACLGIGYIVDIFRLPWLVKDYNSKRPSNIESVSGAVGHNVHVLPPGQSYEPRPGDIVVPAGSYQGGPPLAPGPGLVGPGDVPPYYPQHAGFPHQLQPPQYSGQYPAQYPGQYYPPQGVYPPQGGPLASGDTSWSTINSSDFGGEQPPPYTHQDDNQMNQKLESAAPAMPPAVPPAPSAPTAPEHK